MITITTIMHRGSELSIQWKGHLGPAILSLVGRLSSFRRLKMGCMYTFGGVGSVQVVPFSEGPASLEVQCTVVLKLA